MITVFHLLVFRKGEKNMAENKQLQQENEILHRIIQQEAEKAEAEARRRFVAWYKELRVEAAAI